MPFPQQSPKPFTRPEILSLNPGQEGCYGLFIGNGRWVYVGRGDLRDRLLAHQNGDNACINRERPTHFVTVVTRNSEAEEKKLIEELNPSCNFKVG